MATRAPITREDHRDGPVTTVSNMTNSVTTIGEDHRGGPVVKAPDMVNNATMADEDHWTGPVAMTLDGQWLTLREVVDAKSARLPFDDLSPEQQSELVAKRIERRPTFEVGIISRGIVNKERAIDEVQKRSAYRMHFNRD